MIRPDLYDPGVRDNPFVSIYYQTLRLCQIIVQLISVTS
jgi:hypothetical protein